MPNLESVASRITPLFLLICVISTYFDEGLAIYDTSQALRWYTLCFSVIFSIRYVMRGHVVFYTKLPYTASSVQHSPFSCYRTRPTGNKQAASPITILY